MKNLFCLHGRKVWGPAVLFSHEGSDRSATDVGPSQKVAPLLSESPIFAPSRSIPSGQIALLERRPPNLTIPLAGVHFWHPKWKGGVEFWNQKNCIPSSEQKNVRALEPIFFSFARRYGSFNVPSLEPKKKTQSRLWRPCWPPKWDGPEGAQNSIYRCEWRHFVSKRFFKKK